MVSKRSVRLVMDAGYMSRNHDLSDFDKGQIAMPKKLVQNISDMTGEYYKPQTGDKLV